MQCIMCNQPAVYVRSTQFAGDHPFCKEHAEKEKDFLVNDSYEYWYKLEDEFDSNEIDIEYSFTSNCHCHTCNPIDYKRPDSVYMRLCPICGNKRCPKATDHRLECTNSNEPNQEGSIY